MWDRFFLRCLCSAMSICLAMLGIAAWDLFVMHDGVTASWFAITALELFFLGCIVLLFYIMCLI